MASAARDRLARLLRGDDESAFSTEITLPLEALTLDVEGFGRAKFPVTPAKARRLITLAKPARFGRGTQTLTDPEVRDTWEVPAGLVRPEWDPAVLADVLATVRENLGLSNTAELGVDLHSLLVYEEGQFFLPHQDTEKSDDMIGTIVVTLPSAYDGGELVIGRGAERISYQGSRKSVQAVAFFADCQHEVQKVTAGYRIALTYNLILRGGTSTRPDGKDGTVAELTSLLGEHFATAVKSYARDAGAAPDRLVYLLDHEYTPRGLSWERLKGPDARRARLLRAAAQAAGCEAILGLADIKTTHDAWPANETYGYRRWNDDADLDERYEEDYEVNDELDSDVTLTHWTGPDSSRLEETSLSVGGSEVCASTPNGDLEPYESEYEGYMGNWGNTLDRWYHRGAVVVWPAAQAFANRAETSPAWALDQITAMAAAGDTPGARETADGLGQLWGGLARRKAVPPLHTALRAAQAVADARIAAMLLGPFTIENLTREDAAAFGHLTVQYGRDWTRTLLRGWFSDGQPAWQRGTGQAQWVAQLLPGICGLLHGSGADEAAAQILGLAWDQIRRDVEASLASGPPSWRDKTLSSLGAPLAALLTTALATGALAAATAISDHARQLDGDAVVGLELAALRAAGDLRSGPPASPSADAEGFRGLADDCARRLRDQLARPRREPGDWSVTLPAGGCDCELCADLRDFLAAPDRHMMDWPLAKNRRQHVHSRIDGAELPVTHQTRRQGRPYTLALRKTDDLFARERTARDQAASDLQWLEAIGTSRPDDPKGGAPAKAGT